MAHRQSELLAFNSTPHRLFRSLPSRARTNTQHTQHVASHAWPSAPPLPPAVTHSDASSRRHSPAGTPPLTPSLSAAASSTSFCAVSNAQPRDDCDFDAVPEMEDIEQDDQEREQEDNTPDSLYSYSLPPSVDSASSSSSLSAYSLRNMHRQQQQACQEHDEQSAMRPSKRQRIGNERHQIDSTLSSDCHSTAKKDSGQRDENKAENTVCTTMSLERSNAATVQCHSQPVTLRTTSSLSLCPTSLPSSSASSSQPLSAYSCSEVLLELTGYWQGASRHKHSNTFTQWRPVVLRAIIEDSTVSKPELCTVLQNSSCGGVAGLATITPVPTLRVSASGSSEVCEHFRVRRGAIQGYGSHQSGNFKGTFGIEGEFSVDMYTQYRLLYGRLRKVLPQQPQLDHCAIRILYHFLWCDERTLQNKQHLRTARSHPSFAHAPPLFFSALEALCGNHNNTSKILHKIHLESDIADGSLTAAPEQSQPVV